MKKLILFAAITFAIVLAILLSRKESVSATPGNSSSCLSCHSQSSSLNVTTAFSTKTVAPGEAFPVGISWTGGTSGRITEINWPNTQSNTQFAPSPRVPYSGNNTTGTTTSTLTAPATPGTYVVRVFVARGSPRDSDYADISVTVAAANAAPVLNAIGSKTVVAGQPLQFTISATDPDGNPLTYSATGLPAGATFTAATRTFSWTPAQAGTANVTFQVSDGTATDSEAIVITVTAANVAPVLNAIGGKTMAAGQLLQFTISATDANGSTLTYSATGLPAGATFTPATQTFAWTPTSGQIGNVNVIFQVSDGALTDSEIVAISVTNTAPVLNAIGNKTVTAAQPLQFTISATDANGGTLTYSATGLPTGATFTPATQTFSWIPTAGQVGSHTNITFQVSDASLTDSEIISITVVLGNAPPVLEPIGNKTALVGQLLEFTVTATDANNDTLTYSATGLPSGATFTAATGTFSWTPAQAGTPGVTFQVSDGTLTASESITVTITAGNVAPVLATIGNKTANVGQALQFTIAATDANGGTLTYSATGLPTGATFTASTQTFSWTPASGQASTDVTFQVSDGTLSDSETITITVSTANIAPVLNSIGNKTVTVGQSIQITLSATDANNNPLTYSATGLPSGATFTASTRTFSWTPESGQVGTAGVLFQVSDGTLTDSENIAITVKTPGVPPVINPIGNMSVITAEPLMFMVAATDANGDPLTYSASSLPVGATFNAGTRTFSWTPAENQAGVYPNIVFQVSDGTLTDVESIIITVTAPNTAPVLTPIGNMTILLGQNLGLTLGAVDADNDTLTYSASGLPQGATFNPAARSFAWLPTAAQLGTFEVTFQVTDGEFEDIETVSILVKSGDTVAPKTTLAGSTAAGSDSITIHWKTDEPSTSQVEYWASPHQRTAVDENLVTEHTIRLTGLNPATVYRYVTLSTDKSGNTATSDEMTFETMPSFTISSLVVTPNEAQVGEKVTVTALVTNTANISGTYEINFKVGGAWQSDANLTLGAGERRTVSFTTTRYASGISTVDINGTTGNFMVLPLPPKPFNWIPLAIAGAIIGLGGFAGFWFIRKRKIPAGS